MNLGLLLGEMGRTHDAEQTLRAALKANPRLAQAAYNLGALLGGKRMADGLNWLRQAWEIEPQTPKYGYAYAYSLFVSGQTEQASNVIRAVRARHPDDADAIQLERAILESARKP